MVPEVRVAYYAGLFDGEGCVFVKRKRDRGAEHWWSLQVEASINLIDPTSLIQLHKDFGGQFRRDQKIRVIGRRHLYTWKVVSCDVVPFLRALLPYSVMKREQIELALQLQARISGKMGCFPRRLWKKLGHSMSGDEWAIRLSLARRICDLKWKEFLPAMHGIAAKSGDGANPNPEPSEPDLFTGLACVETMGRRPLLPSGQEIVHSSRN